MMKMLSGYMEETHNVMPPSLKNQMMRVDRLDIWANMQGIKGSCNVYSYPFPYPVGMTREQQKKNKSQIAFNFNCVVEVRSGRNELVKKLMEKYEKIEGIYKTNVVPFEKKDDDYAYSAMKLYSECASLGQKVRNGAIEGAKSTGSLIHGMLTAVWDFVAGVLKLAFGIVKLAAAGVVYIYGNISGDMPKWAEKTIDSFGTNTQAILYDPALIFEAIGQSATDTIDHKGIAYAAGYIAGDIAISYLTGAAVGKVISKGDDVARAAGKLDDVGDAAKVVDKLDDVAGGTGKINETLTSNIGKTYDTTPFLNHTTTTKNPSYQGLPNSSVDIVDASGKVKIRRWYGQDGKAVRDIDMTNHGNIKYHPEWPHEHIWKYGPDGKPIGR